MSKDKFVLLTLSQQPGQEPRIVNVNVIEVPRGSRFVTITCVEDPVKAGR